MTRNPPADPPSGTPEARASAPLGSDDGWAVLSYLLTGVFLFGGAGWGLDAWMGTSFFIVVGLLGGAVLALYVIWLRYGRV